jgi:membrane protease YdiL (CAAX protease family)
VAIVGITSAIFGAAHLGDQRWPGVQQATIVGLVVGTIVAATGRIWLAMIAHAVFDLTALALIYWDLEAKVAHFLFR